MSYTLLVLSSTVSGYDDIKSFALTIFDVFLRISPAFAAIYIGLRNSYYTNKRNNEEKVIEFLEKGLRIYSNLQMKISELNLSGEECIFAMNKENYQVFRYTRRELIKISNESKFWQNLQSQLYQNIKTTDVAPMVKQVCQDTMKVINKAKDEIEANSLINNDEFLQAAYAEIDSHFQTLNLMIAENKKIVLEELKLFYIPKKKNRIRKIITSLKNK